MALYEVRGLAKAFGDNRVLESIDFDLHQGEVLTIIGKSGSGKSVLIKMLIGLLQADAGTIVFDGENVTDRKEHEWAPVRRRVGMMFQEYALFDSMNVFDNVAYGLREQRLLPEPEIAERVAESLASVSLPGIEQMSPKDLSGGMKKRVALARAIAVRPEVVLYDEPTEGLDPINVTRVDRLLLKLRDEQGITTVIVTHNMRSTFRISDRIALVHEGKIELAGTPDEFRAYASDPVIQPYLGASRVSLRPPPPMPPPPQ
ncbi:MAG: ATP-binding cassette domain-containing protein [Myxococcota bacterium]